MYRADQQALIHETNIGVLEVRRSELEYRSDLNIAFGLQAALIGGFSYDIYYENRVNAENDYAETFINIYYVVSACTIASAVHIILSTMAIQILGPGLALNGPVGSTVRAVEGMRIEQKSIVVAFIFMMVCFSLSTVLIFWSVYDFYPAIISSGLFLVAWYFWYSYCERIYLRFFWDEQDTRWNPEDRESMFPGENMMVNPSQDPSPVTSEPEKKRPILRLINVPRIWRTTKPASPRTSLNSTEMKNTRLNNPVPPVDILMEGYLVTSSGANDSWERRYLTLNRRGHFYVYKSRLDYRADATKPLLTRPIELPDYLVDVFNSEDEALPEDNQSTVSKMNQSAIFQITLQQSSEPSKNSKDNWLFRCDTEEELIAWVTVLRTLVPNNFKN